MAKLDKSFVRLRFSFGASEVKGRQRYENTAAYIAGKVAIAYADDVWEKAKATLADRIQQDVERELVHTAYLFRRHINGLGGSRSGVLTSAVGGAQPLALSSALPPWAPRGAVYLERKAAAGAGKRWFNNTGWRARRGQSAEYPRDPGRLVQEINSGLFERAYGPIKVTIVRNNRTTPNDAAGFIALGKKKDMHVQVASIRVSALRRINPGILPTLRTGNFSGVENPAIPRMIYSSGVPFAAQIAQRLGPTSRGRYVPGGTGVYRPTLEPFIGYFLTRSIPAAVGARIKQGGLGRVVRS